MEAKKSPQVDLEKKRTLFIQIGLLVSLSIVLFAFELKTIRKALDGSHLKYGTNRS
jgi:periplasmic protein TonB